MEFDSPPVVLRLVEPLDVIADDLEIFPVPEKMNQLGFNEWTHASREDNYRNIFLDAPIVKRFEVRVDLHVFTEYFFALIEREMYAIKHILEGISAASQD